MTHSDSLVGVWCSGILTCTGKQCAGLQGDDLVRFMVYHREDERER